MKAINSDERVMGLVEENMGLAGAALKKYLKYMPQNSMNTYKDFYSIALAGLWKAAKAYDESKGVTFASFAFPVIRNNLFAIFKKYKRSCNDYSIDPLIINRALDTQQVSPEIAYTSQVSVEQALPEFDAILEGSVVAALLDAHNRYDSTPARSGIKALLLRHEGYSTERIKDALGVGNSRTVSAYMGIARKKLCSDLEFLQAVS